jgi:hypothetical protein
MKIKKLNESYNWVKAGPRSYKLYTDKGTAEIYKPISGNRFELTVYDKNGNYFVGPTDVDRMYYNDKQQAMKVAERYLIVDLGESITLPKEFEEYKNLWEDWSTRYTKGKYEASINNDRYEDPSFEDEFLPMDFVISKEGKSIETVRGLGRVRKRIDELIAQDVKNYKKSLANKYVINFDYNGSLGNDVTAEALADVYIKYEVMDDALSTYCSFDITDVKLFDSYEQAKDFLESLNEKFYNLTGTVIWFDEIDEADDFITPALDLDNRYFSFLTK